MTPEALNIAIAEKMGWEQLDDSTRVHAGLNRSYYYAVRPNGEYAYSIPDFYTDLNACHEAEKALTEEQQVAFAESLYYDSEVTSGYILDEHTRGYETYSEMNWKEAFLLAHATAPQRAESLAKTLGVWRE